MSAQNYRGEFNPLMEEQANVSVHTVLYTAVVNKDNQPQVILDFLEEVYTNRSNKIDIYICYVNLGWKELSKNIM